MKKLPFLFSLFLLVLAGCEFGNKEKAIVGDNLPPVPRATFVDYELEQVKEFKGPCTDKESGEKCFSIDIQYPVIKEGAPRPILDSINIHIEKEILKYAFINEPKDDFELLIKEMAAAYGKILEENKDYNAGWLLEISSDIIYQDSTFISTASTIFSYTGGAHPSSFQVYRSYNLTTGEVIKLGDFLVEGYEEKLNELAEIEFRMDKQIPPEQSLEEEGYFFEDGNFKLNDNFAIINNSLLFYYNPYEIGPYSLGATELELKLTDYVRLIKEGSILSKLKL